MALSEQEQRALREIERSLLAEDPEFRRAVKSSELPSGSGLTLRGVAVIVIGMVMLVGGLALTQYSLWTVALSVLGFVVMVAGGVWMVRGGGQPVRQGHSAPKAVKVKPGGAGLSSKLEENFRKRFEG